MLILSLEQVLVVAVEMELIPILAQMLNSVVYGINFARDVVYVLLEIQFINSLIAYRVKGIVGL